MTTLVQPNQTNNLPDTVDSSDDDAVLNKILQDYKWAANYRAGFKSEWDRFYRLYKGKVSRPGDVYPFESNVFIPYTFSVIETQIPMMLQQLFASGQFLEVHGRRVDDQINAPIVHDIVKYQFERNINIHPLMYAHCKQALMYGTSPCLIDWNYETMPVKVRVPKMNLDGSPVGSKTVEGKRVVANNPIAKVIDINRYFQCPITPESPCSSNDVLFAGWEFTAPYDELLADAQNGLYDIDKVKQCDSAGNASAAGFQYLEDRAAQLGRNGPMNTMIDKRSRNLIPCIRYFGKFNVDGKYRYKIATIAFPGGLPDYGQNVNVPGSGVGVLIQFEDCPFNYTRIPISLCRVNWCEGELYGMGDIEIIESLQMELTDQRNQRNDIIVRLMNPMFTKLRGASIDEGQLLYRPMGMVEVDSHEDIKPLITDQSVLQSAFTEERVIKQDIQFASGVSDFIVGQFQNSSGFNDTATGISLIQAAAQGRIVLKSQFIQVSIKEIAEVVWALDQQFLPYDTVVKVLDPLSASRYQFIRATPDIINGQYDFSIFNAPAAGNPQVRQNQLIQVLQVVNQTMQIAAQSGQPIQVNYGNLIKRIFQEFEIPNVGEILPQVGALGLINQIPSQIDQAASQGQELDPEVENDLMAQGQTVNVQPGDDDVMHILSHNKFAQDADVDTKKREDQHIAMHSAQLQKKRQMLLMQTQDTAQQLAASQPNGAPTQQDAQTALDPQMAMAAMASQMPNAAMPGNSSSPNDAGGAESAVRNAANAAAGNG